MSTTRVDPPGAADERSMLMSWLDYERGTLRLKCDGLSPEQLRERAVPPSSLSLLGIVRHMTDVERGWFTRGVAGESAGPLYYSESDQDGDFNNLDDTDPAKVFEVWDEECARSRELVGRASLDGALKGRHQELTVRWVLVHMIEEYARHNGHADFLRERIDGATGE